MLQPKRNNEATRQDSIAIYNNSIEVSKYYNDKKKYIKHPKAAKYAINPKEAHKINQLAAKNFKKKYDKKETTKVLTKDGKDSEQKVISPSKYRKDINSNQYMQRESANSILDTRSPMQLFDKRMDPQNVTTYMNKSKPILDRLMGKATNDPLAGDLVEIFEYDPLAVKPFDLLTDKQKAQRVKQYGRNGVPDSYGKSLNTKENYSYKISKRSLSLETKENPSIIKPKPITKVNSLSNKDFKTDSKIPTADFTINNKKDFIKPKSYDIIEKSPAKFGGRTVKYSVSDSNNINTDENQTTNGNTRVVTPRYKNGGKINLKRK